MIPRRLVRVGIQAGLFITAILFIVLIADSKFRLLPTALHEHLPSHHPGLVITDVKIVSCSSLNPFSKCTLNPAEWHRVEKNLYLNKAWTSSAYVHIARKKEEEVNANDPVVVDLKIGRLNPGAGSENNFESRGYGVWISRQPKSQADIDRVLTSIDVLFGVDAAEPRRGWELKDMMLVDSASEPRLSIRRHPLPKKEPPVPRIRKDGKFKIMQLADLHLSTGVDVCREPTPKVKDPKQCEADPRTLQFVEKLIEEEKPDLAILSGDQVNGDTAPDAESAIFKIVDVLARNKVPYAAIFGNHDDEGNLDRSQSMALLEELPYSLSHAGPVDVDGVGNYYIEVKERGTAGHSALTLYLLDTHAYSPDEKKYHGYDWIKPSQIEWFRETAQSLKRDHQQYTHIHMNLAFVHIPLPEYRHYENPWVGNWLEAPTAPNYNSGFTAELVKENVVLVSCGHDHVNDYCLLEKKKDGDPEIWMCYGGATGFGGYAGPGYGDYIRRVRFFDIDMNSARIITYKRLEYGETDKRIDEQMVVDGGHPIAPPT